MKNTIALLAGLLSCLISFSQDSYKIEMNLNEVVSDQIKVRLYPPALKSDTATYYMPLIIPGSYEIKDYNRFVKKFKAYDKSGNAMKYKKITSGYQFTNAKQLGHVEYFVNDSWDDKKKPNYVFQPGGTNINMDVNYVINHFGFYGYFDGYKMVPYQIEIAKPAKMYGATSLERKESGREKDIFYAQSYPKLVDNPVMYCVPDTCSFTSGGALIRVSTYSPNRAVTSSQICEMIKPLSKALANFFGEMPVDEYNFIFYFAGHQEKTITKLGGYGALEHSYSSFYFLPEQHNRSKLEEMVMDVVAHEFLHILTPLNIQSEEIHDFDFVVPDMSQHLWMYEGVTEYFSHLVQIRDSLVTEEDFLIEMRTKIVTAEEYKDVSFTTMSKEILKDPYKDMYSNVYQKGALLGFLLDIRINELTNSRLNLKRVMLQLAQNYGPQKPFKDEELIDEIVSMTDPALKEFFTRYVIGDKPLPFAEYFDKLGYEYARAKPDTINSYGTLGFRYDPEKDEFLVSNAHPSYNSLGLQTGDRIIKVGDVALNKENYGELLKKLSSPDAVFNAKLVIQRGDKFYNVSGKTIKLPVTQLHYIGENPEATEAQLELRKNLLYLN